MSLQNYEQVDWSRIRDPGLRSALETMDRNLQTAHSYLTDIVRDDSQRGETRLSTPIAPRALERDPTSNMTYGMVNEVAVNPDSGALYVKRYNTGTNTDWSIVGGGSGGLPGLHASTHLPTSGIDALSVGTPVNVDVGANAAGSADAFARSDHQHYLDEDIDPTWTGAHSFEPDSDFTPITIDGFSGGSEALLRFESGGVLVGDILPSGNWRLNTAGIAESSVPENSKIVLVGPVETATSFPIGQATLYDTAAYNASPAPRGTISFGGFFNAAAVNFTTWGAVSGIKENALDDDALGALLFHTRESDTASQMSEKMRISSEGYIGIGTGTPGRRLHVYDLSASVGQVELFKLQTSSISGRPVMKLSDGTTEINAFGLSTGTIGISRTTGAVGIGLGDNSDSSNLADANGLHVKTGSSGATTVPASGKIAVFEGGSTSGITIAGGAGATGFSWINFVQSADSTAKGINYAYATDRFNFWCADTSVMSMEDPYIVLKGTGGTPTGPVLRFNSVSSTEPDIGPSDWGDLYTKTVGSNTELFFWYDDGATGTSISLTPGGYGGHAIEDGGSPVVNQPTLNFFTGLDATVVGSKINVSIDPADNVNITGGGAWTFGAIASGSSYVNLWAVSDQISQHAGGTPGPFKFRINSQDATYGAQFQVDSGTPTYPFSLIEDAIGPHLGLALHKDGHLLCAKGGSNYDWSGGLKEVACVDYDEPAVSGDWIISGSWIFTSNGFQIAARATAVDTYIDFTNNIGGGAGQTKRFHYDIIDTRFEMDDDLFLNGLQVQVEPVVTTDAVSGWANGDYYGQQKIFSDGGSPPTHTLFTWLSGPSGDAGWVWTAEGG
jgi:hypothetical protein